MKKTTSNNKIVRGLRFLYLKIIRMHDSPHKIAFGMGLGVFTGIMPGMGLVAAFFLAMVLRANRAAALLGSFLSNTWLSVITFLLSIKVGSVIIMREPQETLARCKETLQHFHWKSLFDISVIDVLLPLIVGYIVISMAAGLLVYVATGLFLRLRRLSGRRIKGIS
jgi:hypothetical protein